MTRPIVTVSEMFVEMLVANILSWWSPEPIPPGFCEWKCRNVFEERLTLTDNLTEKDRTIQLLHESLTVLHVMEHKEKSSLDEHFVAAKRGCRIAEMHEQSLCQRLFPAELLQVLKE